MAALFVLAWMMLWLYARFLTIYQSNIPQDIFDSGFIEEGELSLWGLFATWGVLIYFVGYLIFSGYLFFRKKISVKQLVLFAGALVFVGGLMVLIS